MKLIGFRFLLGKKLTGFSKIINAYKIKKIHFLSIWTHKKSYLFLKKKKIVPISKIVQLSYYLNKNLLFMK